MHYRNEEKSVALHLFIVCKFFNLNQSVLILFLKQVRFINMHYQNEQNSANALPQKRTTFQKPPFDTERLPACRKRSIGFIKSPK